MEYSEDSQPNAIIKVLDYNPPTRKETYQQDNEQKKEQFKSESLENVETVMGVRYLLYCCRFLGIYIPKKNKLLYLGWSFVINMLATVYFPVGFIMGFMSLSGKMDIGNLLTSLQAAINDLACGIKIISIGFFLPKLLSCEPILKRLDKRCRHKEEIKSIKRFIRQGNSIAVLFAICYLCYTFSTCISSLILHRLPFNLYNPLLNTKDSNDHFHLALFVEMALVNIALCQQVANDSYPVIYVNMLRTHLNILFKRIGNLNSSASKSSETNLEELKMCIIDHKHIIEIYNIVAPIISVTIFVQFTVTATALCITLINIVIFATDFASIVACCFYVLAVVVEIFPLCYYAQCLMDESNRLPDVIFHSNWADQDMRYRKMLIFFMHRSQRTIEFKAGKMFPITLNSFLSIAKFAFSLYTVIYEMGLKEKFAE